MARPKKVVHFKVTKFANASSATFSWRVTGTKKDDVRVRKGFADRAERIRSRQTSN